MASATARPRRWVRWACIAAAGWLVAIVAVFSPMGRVAGGGRETDRGWRHVDDGGEATTMGPRLGAQFETRDLGSMDAKVAAVTGEASARLLAKTLETNAAVGRLQDALLSDLEASSEVLERVGGVSEALPNTSSSVENNNA